MFEVRQPASGNRLWAWGLTNEKPPGFESMWFTLPGDATDVPEASFSNVVVERHLFTYTIRESKLEAG